ncbi:MAG: hypothetical protein QY310_11900 [Candidatus Jettenia sp. CY-1]|nr:MAG: hypothetical protein QY310_11900 [Candidatus Jettenia sp. CY-1]
MFRNFNICVVAYQTTASNGQQAQYILGIPEIFTFFVLMLRPIKILVPFVKMTRDTDTRFQRKLSLIATLISTIGCLVAAFMGQRILKFWHISINLNKDGLNDKSFIKKERRVVL